MNRGIVGALAHYWLIKISTFLQLIFLNLVTNIFNINNKYIGFRRTHFPGSATATICVLNNRDLTALNLGDSGFLLIRFDMLANEPYILLKSKE